MSIQLKVANHAFVVPEANDPCELWVNYYNSLVSVVGVANARTIWLVTWKHNGSNVCTTNTNFNTWLQKNKIDVSSIATRFIADSAAIGGNFMNLSKRISSVAMVAVPITLSLVIAMIGWVLWNTAKKADASDLAMLTPMGKSVGAGIKFLNR